MVGPAAGPLMLIVPSRSALSRSDASGRAPASRITRSSGVPAPSPAVPSIAIVPGPAWPRRPATRSVLPSAWIVPPIALIRSPCAKSSIDALLSVAVPAGAGAASVPPTRASSAIRPVARRPSAARTRSSTAKSSAPVSRMSRAPAPSGTRPLAFSVAVPACARAVTCAAPPASCAVPSSERGGACGAAAARRPAACTRTVPVGAAAKPARLASMATLPWPSRPGTSARAGAPARSLAVAFRVGLIRPATSSSDCRAPSSSRSMLTPSARRSVAGASSRILSPRTPAVSAARRTMRAGPSTAPDRSKVTGLPAARPLPFARTATALTGPFASIRARPPA